MTPFFETPDWMHDSAPLLMLADVVIIYGLIFWRRWSRNGKPLPLWLMWLRRVPVAGRLFVPMFVTLKGW